MLLFMPHLRRPSGFIVARCCLNVYFKLVTLLSPMFDASKLSGFMRPRWKSDASRWARLAVPLRSRGKGHAHP